MKKAFVLLLIAVVIGATTGCANGPIRSLFKRSCNTCSAPSAEPGYGLGFDESGGPAGECVNCQYGNSSSPSYMQNGYNDPYVQGSNYGGAAISPPVFDSYSNPSYGDTIVPPTSSGTLPTPGGGF